LLKKYFIIIGIIAAFLLKCACYGAVSEKEESPLQGSALFINLKSDKVKYLPEKDQFVATGNVSIEIPDQGVRVESEKVILDQTSQQIISEGNVKIFKRDTVINGDYARFDLTKDSVLINNPSAEMPEIRINAETAEIVSSDIELLKGKASITRQNLIIPLSSGTFRRNSGNNRFLQSTTTADPKLKYDIKAKEVVIDEYEYYNIVTLKNALIKINKYPIAKVPEMQLTKDRYDNRIETMLPEFGSRRRLGAYFGHGHVFHVHKGDTLKVLPIVAFGEGGVGFGGMGRYMSKTNRTEMLYSTLKKNVVVEGEQDLPFISGDTYLQYGTHAFIENGFFGRQDPQYIVEVVDDRKLAEAYNMRFDLRSSAGFAEEVGNFSTGKFQVQGSARTIEPLFGYGKYVDVGLDSNFSLSAYGTGDAYGVARIGPTVASNFGPVNLWAAYYQGTIHGETPFLYDRYLYGKSNVMFMGSVKITKYLTLGYLTSLNLTKDNWNKELVVENQIFAWIGPDELKFKIGYDSERERTVFGFDMLVGSETSAFEFEKLKVKQKK